MGKRVLKAFIIMISSFAASIGLAACSIVGVVNQTNDNPTTTVPTTSNHTSSNSTIPTSDTPTTSDSTTSNPTTDTPTSSSAPSTSTPTTEDHSHNYDQQVVDDIYKASDADCEHAATYYYSCSCGDRCSETFEHGSPLGHDYQLEYFETLEGEYGQRERCSRCDKTGEIKLDQSIKNLTFTVTSEEKKTCKVTSYDGRDNTIVIPRFWNGYTVTSIGERAFYGCTLITSIVISNSVTSIGDRAFFYCASLTSIVIPDSVTSIGSYAFYNCTSLTSITIGNGVKSIGEGAFYVCSSLTSIVIPDSVTSIRNSVFWGCSSLTDVYYIGTEVQWNAISIGSSNAPLTSATIHYNYTGE